MRRSISAVALAISLGGFASQAHALGPVYCTNCATQVSQLASMAKQASQYAEQVQSYGLQLRQYANMIQNTTALPMEMWENVQSDIMQVHSLSNAAGLLSGNAGSIIGRLNSASGYVSSVANLGNVAGQFTEWQNTIGNSTQALGRTLGLQEGQENSNAALLAALEAHSQSAAGQLQAIQAGNELAAQNAAQLQQLQSTLSATAQTEATVIAVNADRRAQEDAAMMQFAQPPTQLGGGRSW